MHRPAGQTGAVTTCRRRTRLRRKLCPILPLRGRTRRNSPTSLDSIGRLQVLLAVEDQQAIEYKVKGNCLYLPEGGV